MTGSIIPEERGTTPATTAQPASAPAVTVVLPVYNQERYLPAALASVLRQSYRNFKLLVVDDGSTDATPRILDSIEDLRLEIVRANHLGFIKALRAGVERATTPWIARMDSDDICAPERLERQIAFLERHPECVFVGSVFGIVTPNDHFLVPTQQFDWRSLTRDDITFAKVAFADPSTVFARELALNVGLYDEDFPKNEKALWYKMLSRGMGAVLGSPLYYYRWRLGSINKADFTKLWRDNNEIRKRYHPESAPAMDERVPPSERRVNLMAASRAQHYSLVAGDLKEARQLGWSALRNEPLHTEAWKMALRAMLGTATLRGRFGAVEDHIGYRPVVQPW